ncbi:hypothetical protein [Psychroflexus aestuariivivens]|uniref:hypothetical protein n=1 Tax=Psychroflexus aestuariivivens TaxID=1795040 RepID=UPI000FD8C808|nr:hypothetical protein [Psychroflexus aestuariivivens]
MRKIRFTKTEKRVIIILMSINLFALTVNYFGLSPKIKDYENNVLIEYFIFTDAKEKPYHTQFKTNITPHSSRVNYKYHHGKEFYPFLDFYVDLRDEEKFRGLFPSFDHTEFLVYSSLIFGIPLIRKIW